MAAALTLARTCPELRTLLGDCGDGSGTVYCVTAASDADDDDDGDGGTSADESGSRSADDATCAAESVDAGQVASLGIQAVDLSSVNSSSGLSILNLASNDITDAADVKVPSGLAQLNLSSNQLEQLEFQAQWGRLQVLDASNNPITAFSAPTKFGPQTLFARNVTVRNMTASTFSDMTQTIDLSGSTISTYEGFSPPTDLHQLIVRNCSVQVIKGLDFSDCNRPFLMDFTGNSVATIQGVVFPANLQSLLLNGSTLSYFEIRESDEAVLSALEVFEVDGVALNRSCVSKAEERQVVIGNSSYSVCVLPDSVFRSKYGFGSSSVSVTNIMTPFLLLFGIGGVVFVLILLLICKRKRYEQQREQEKGRRRGNTLRDSAVALTALGVESSTPMTAASRGTSRAASVDSAFELSSRRGGVVTDDVRKDPDFENLRIAQSDIDRQNEIAKGGGGIVYLALLLSTNEHVVLKQMYPDKVKKNHQVIERFMMEIRLCSRLKHDKIVAFRGIAWSSLVDLSMVIEYMPNGDLAQFLERQRLMDPDREGWCWSSRESAGYGRSKLAFALDVSDAVLYLHSFSDPVIHRDLKAQNVLLSKTWVAKLSDFGASRVKSGSETAMQMTAEVGTVAWIAPEIIRGDKYDQQADIYSFGVVLCEIDTCAKPFAVGMCTCDGEAVQEDAEEDGDDLASHRRSSRGGIMGSNAILAMAVSEDRVRPAFHRDCPRAIRSLGLRCMSGDPRERPTAKEVYSALRTIEEQDQEDAV